MNREIKKKWIAALRSGDYLQGRGVLRTRDSSYCCLGVLCDIYSKETGINFWETIDDGKFSFMKSRDILPKVVSEWAEVDRNGSYDVEKNCLAYLNDKGKDFNYIANIIEEDL